MISYENYKIGLVIIIIIYKEIIIYKIVVIYIVKYTGH